VYANCRARYAGTDGRTTYPHSLRALAEEAGGDGSKLASAMEDEGREPSSSDFGTLLRRYRLTAGLSQEALAERARVSLDGISALERGYRRTPQRQTLALLAGALALSADQRRAFEAAAARPSLPRRRAGTSVTVGPWPTAQSASLPFSLATFVGRDAELDEIGALLRVHRLVTITGSGGVGKTQTALRAATVVSGATEDHLCFAGLAPIGDPSLVTTVIASAAGVQEVPHHPLLETLIAYLRNRTLILIIDNCEHVMTEAASVTAALLQSCPRIRILATSREPFRMAGERAYRLPSLTAPDAMALFVDRAQAVDARFVLAHEDTRTVAEICRRLDGVPLAIELAAARVNVLPVKGLLERLDDRFSLLTERERNALPRHQTMRATIEWSYDLLAAREQRLFERLSVFAGGCTLTAATAVCTGIGVEGADVLGLMSSLIDKSVVVADLRAAEPRYYLLESFRQFADAKLAQRHEQAGVVHRHALAYLELAKSIKRGETAEPEERPRRLALELGNWRKAMQWALTDRGDVALGQRLAAELVDLGGNYFGFDERRRWLTTALQLIDDQTPRSALAALSLAQARIAENLMQYGVQLLSSESALAHYRVLGDKYGTARALGYASYALFCLGRGTEAAALLGEALPIARALEGFDRQVLAYNLRIRALATKNDIVSARRDIAEAMQIYEMLKDPVGANFALADLARCEFAEGGAELALAQAGNALAAALEIPHALSQAYALNDMSLYLLSLERYDEAQQRAREGLALAREHHFDVQATCALEHMAEIAALRPRGEAKNPAAARTKTAQLLGFVDARFKALGSVRQYTSQPQYDRALVALREAVGDDELTKLMAEGAELTEEQAVEAALEL